MSQVRLKQSYGQGYCSITLKHNYVSSRRLLHAHNRLSCSCFVLLRHLSAFAEDGQTGGTVTPLGSLQLLLSDLVWIRFPVSNSTPGEDH